MTDSLASAAAAVPAALLAVTGLRLRSAFAAAPWTGRRHSPASCLCARRARLRRTVPPCTVVSPQPAAPSAAASAASTMRLPGIVRMGATGRGRDAGDHRCVFGLIWAGLVGEMSGRTRAMGPGPRLPSVIWVYRSLDPDLAGRGRLEPVAQACVSANRSSASSGPLLVGHGTRDTRRSGITSNVATVVGQRQRCSTELGVHRPPSRTPRLNGFSCPLGADPSHTVSSLTAGISAYRRTLQRGLWRLLCFVELRASELACTRRIPTRSSCSFGGASVRRSLLLSRTPSYSSSRVGSGARPPATDQAYRSRPLNLRCGRLPNRGTCSSVYALLL